MKRKRQIEYIKIKRKIKRKCDVHLPIIQYIHDKALSTSQFKLSQPNLTINGLFLHSLICHCKITFSWKRETGQAETEYDRSPLPTRRRTGGAEKSYIHKYKFEIFFCHQKNFRVNKSRILFEGFDVRKKVRDKYVGYVWGISVDASLETRCRCVPIRLVNYYSAKVKKMEREIKRRCNVCRYLPVILSITKALSTTAPARKTGERALPTSQFDLFTWVPHLYPKLTTKVLFLLSLIFHCNS